MRAKVATITLVLVVLGTACTSSVGAPQCTPGAAAECFCAGGVRGGQVCRADGTFGACDCGTPPDSGVGSDGGPDGGPGSPDAGSCQSPDAGTVVLPAAPQALPDRTSLRFGLAFGEGVRVGSAVTETLLVRNGGQALLTVTGASLSGPGAASFRVASGGSGATVTSGDVAPIQIEYRAQTAGDTSATLTVQSNAANEPTLVIGLQARAVAN